VERIFRTTFARPALSITVLVLALAACQGQPVPLAAARGTTVLIAIGGGGSSLGDGVRMGYGTAGDPDYQRGRLRLWLDVNPGADVELTVRGIARVAADPASPAGLNGGIQEKELSGQVVLLVDIPDTTPVGTWPLYAQRHVPQWNSGSSTWEEVSTTPAPEYQYDLEVLPEVRSPTPFTGYTDFTGEIPDISEEVLDFKPLPKFRFTFSNQTVGALRFTITYPPNRAAVRAVLTEPLGDTTAWGQNALISYTEATQGTLVVSCVAPTGVFAAAFAVVFELTNPTAAPPVGGPLTTSDFVISGIQAWDVSGAAATVSVPAASKKIF